jgi:hypothetical protein
MICPCASAEKNVLSVDPSDRVNGNCRLKTDSRTTSGIVPLSLLVEKVMDPNLD